MFNVRVPKELIPVMADWLETVGYHMGGTGVQDCSLRDREPSLFVFKKQSNPQPATFAPVEAADWAPEHDDDE